MKYRVLEVLFGLVFLVGLYLFAHDTVPTSSTICGRTAR